MAVELLNDPTISSSITPVFNGLVSTHGIISTTYKDNGGGPQGEPALTIAATDPASQSTEARWQLQLTGVEGADDEGGSSLQFTSISNANARATAATLTRDGTFVTPTSLITGTVRAPTLTTSTGPLNITTSAAGSSILLTPGTSASPGNVIIQPAAPGGTGSLLISGPSGLAPVYSAYNAPPPTPPGPATAVAGATQLTISGPQVTLPPVPTNPSSFTAWKDLLSNVALNPGVYLVQYLFNLIAAPGTAVYFNANDTAAFQIIPVGGGTPYSYAEFLGYFYTPAPGSGSINNVQARTDIVVIPGTTQVNVEIQVQMYRGDTGANSLSYSTAAGTASWGAVQIMKLANVPM